MPNKVIRLDAHSIARMRRRHRVHFGGGRRTNIAPVARAYRATSPDAEGWEFPASFAVDPVLQQLASTVNELLESVSEAQREVMVAERERDDAIVATVETRAERDTIALERDLLADAHAAASSQLADAHQEVDTLRAALGEVSHTLRKSNANVRRLHDDIAAIRREVRQVAQSPWAKLVQKRLLTTIRSLDS